MCGGKFEFQNRLGFLGYDFGGLIFGRGLYMEGLIFGIFTVFESCHIR